MVLLMDDENTMDWKGEILRESGNKKDTYLTPERDNLNF